MPFYILVHAIVYTSLILYTKYVAENSPNLQAFSLLIYNVRNFMNLPPYEPSL